MKRPRATVWNVRDGQRWPKHRAGPSASRRSSAGCARWSTTRRGKPPARRQPARVRGGHGAVPPRHGDPRRRREEGRDAARRGADRAVRPVEEPMAANRRRTPARTVWPPGSPRGAPSSTACSRRGWRRRPTAIPGGWSKRCATRCWRPASGSARCWRWPPPRRSAPLDDDVRLACAAVELVHCYSLIHDDLPAMDDDDFRRGRPSNHKVFGEATAILAGDALLTLAFDWIAEAGERAGRPAGFPAAARALAHGAGVRGMVRGQARDLGEPPPATLAALERCTPRRPAALFRAALEVGGGAAGATPDSVAPWRRFGDRLRHRLPARRRSRPTPNMPRTPRRRGARLEAPDRRGLRGAIAPLGPRGERLARIRPRSVAPTGVSRRHCPAIAVVIPSRSMPADESTRMFEPPVAPAGAKAGSRLPGGAGRRERRRDVQGRGREDHHRPRPEGADPAVRRRHLARARADRDRGQPDLPAGPRVDQRHLLQRPQGRRRRSWPTATRSWSARPRSSSSPTTTTWTRSSRSRCTSRRCATG